MEGSAAPVTGSSSHGGLFTCVTCHVGFAAAEDQRLHYKTEWHRYNLKRKVADMNPVTQQDFEGRLAAQQLKEKQDEDKANFSAFCEACGKQYSTANSYENHINSKKHKENAAKSESNPKRPSDTPKKLSSDDSTKSSITWDSLIPTSSDQEASSVSMVDVLATQLTKGVVISNDEDAVDETASEMDFADEKIANARFLTPTECLFCLHTSDTFDTNVDHMTSKHSLFVPDVEYLVNLPGLIKYLGEKVSVGNACLFCNKVFLSLDAVQKHMSDKGHCKILYEGDGELELSDFYDFSSSYPTYQDGQENITEEDERLQQMIISSDETELVLPGGARLGHRSLNRYYKQNLRPTESRDSVLISKLMSNYKALGWHDQPTAVKKDMTVYLRRKQDWRMKVGVNANRLQAHFRHQVLF